jgi:hypothetical protein
MYTQKSFLAATLLAALTLTSNAHAGADYGTEPAMDPLLNSVSTSLSHKLDIQDVTPEINMQGQSSSTYVPIVSGGELLEAEQNLSTGDSYSTEPRVAATGS